MSWKRSSSSGLKTFYKEVCLLDQPFIFDDKKTVAQALKESEGKVGRLRSRSLASYALRSARGSNGRPVISVEKWRPLPALTKTLLSPVGFSGQMR